LKWKIKLYFAGKGVLREQGKKTLAEGHLAGDEGEIKRNDN